VSRHAIGWRLPTTDYSPTSQRLRSTADLTRTDNRKRL